jgi:hypothetical protein
MDLIHYVVKDGVLDSAAQLGDAISPMDQHGASEVELRSVCPILPEHCSLNKVNMYRCILKSPRVIGHVIVDIKPAFWR